MKIDAHQHFWELERGDYTWLTPDLAPIYRDFTPNNLRPLLDTHNFEGTILVQAADSDGETDYMLSLADQYDWILGVVGWVDMESPTAAKRLAMLAENPKLVSIRPMIQDIDDDNWMLRPDLKPAFDALAKLGLRFDALLKPRHLAPFQRFLKLYPELRIVINHCAKPDIRNQAFQPWADQISDIAEYSQCYCKLSGLVTEAAPEWSDEDIIPYARHILSCFGPDRVIFGSDWPVLNLAADYRRWVALVQKLTTEKEYDRLFGDNAHAFYLRG